MQPVFHSKGALGRTALALGFAAGIGAPLIAQDASALVGTWVGDLKVQAQSIPLVLNVALEGGGLKASLDSPNQGAKGIPVSSISLKDGRVKLESAPLKASYEGVLSADGFRIEGTWTQGGASLPLNVEKREFAPVQNRPQEPKPPFPYKTEEVKIKSKKAGIVLAGSLVLPKTLATGAAAKGPFPALVFATGSGPQNRDEELLGHKPFLVIADYLARRGIASLRFDDRGVGKSTGDFESATTLDFADDVEGAFEYLASRREIKKGAAGILGHSEGGLIAPIVASRNARVAFVVLLAGPGIPGEEILYLQGRLIARAAGTPESEIDQGEAINRRLYAIAKGPGDEAQVKAEAEAAYLDWVDSSATMKADEKESARKMAGQAMAPISSPWFRAFLGLDPAPYLAKVGQPLIALNGEKDLQVPPAENLAAIRKALGVGLASGPSPKSAFVELPGLNHLFQHAASGSPSEYGSIEETIAPEALKSIADWVAGL
jgi:pimeloyl-ACP methyl ester carboxylesterase